MAEAEDITQEALARAWLKRDACAGVDPLPWVLTIVRREAGAHIDGHGTSLAIPLRWSTGRGPTRSTAWRPAWACRRR